MENIKKFTENFFSSLKSEISWRGNTLYVANVPEKFEKFFGKKSPYEIVFEESELSGNRELINKGSYLLKCMSSYLENKGKTTLLKINFKLEKDLNSELKNLFNLMNSDTAEISKKIRNKLFVRFTFQTNFRFLNRVEKSINQIFIHDGKVVKGDLDSYDICEGDSKDIETSEIKEDYEIAKKEISERLTKKTKEVSDFLKANLLDEIKRIETHFKQCTSEISDSIKQNQDKIQALRNEINKNPSEKGNLDEKIAKLEEAIKKLKDSSKLEDFERERESEIKSEKIKNSLNIENKLINTTIIYYPVIVFSVFIKNSSSARVFELSYNPLIDEWSKLVCESCGEKIENIFLCSSGHLSCNNCFNSCPSCNKGFCEKCLTKVCNICERKVCKDCIIRCSSCGKSVCKNHSAEDEMSGKISCTNCLEKCPNCHEYKNPKYFRKSLKKNIKICEKCSIKEINEDVKNNLGM